jgi:hypothetical protein
MNAKDLNKVIDQAWELSSYCNYVVIVPKDINMIPHFNDVIPQNFILGYSVPTRYGATPISPDNFKRPVHLLGGRPDVQRKLADNLPVFSFDCNRFTFDVSYGDYFDGSIFRPHPSGGYEKCIEDSIKNINAIWQNYDAQGRKHNDGEYEYTATNTKQQ